MLKNQFSFLANFEEIKSSRVLTIYGALLSFIVPLSAANWIYLDYAKVMSSEHLAICWPFVESCNSLRILSAEQLTIIFWSLIVLGFFNAFLFLKPKFLKSGWYLLLGLNMLKMSLMLLDFRTRQNQHIMAFWILIAFLFFPHKKFTIKALLISFYFWAGTLKFNHEWLSGSALYGNLWPLQGMWISVACTYVIVLEILFIWGLVLKDKKWQMFTLFQLFIFHLFSFGIVGFFYPLLMYVLLSIFVLSWPTPEIPFLRNGNLGVSISLIMAFSLTQFAPKFLPGDTSVTGEGRMLSLHMFDAKIMCVSNAKIKYTDGTSLSKSLRRPLPFRLRCDPIVYLSLLKNLCEEQLKARADFNDIDFTLSSKKTSDKEMTKVLNLENVCHNPRHYSVFSSNDWILK